MTRNEERKAFIRALIREFGGSITAEQLDIADDLMRLARRYQRLCVELRNHDLTDRQQADKDRTAERGEALAEKLGCKLITGGDPRGYTFKLIMSRTQQHNTLGGTECGWGIPTE